MTGKIYGWFKQVSGIARFLKAYSIAGGTYHMAIIYTDKPDRTAEKL